MTRAPVTSAPVHQSFLLCHPGVPYFYILQMPAEPAHPQVAEGHLFSRHFLHKNKTSLAITSFFMHEWLCHSLCPFVRKQSKLNFHCFLPHVHMSVRGSFVASLLGIRNPPPSAYKIPRGLAGCPVRVPQAKGRGLFEHRDTLPVLMSRFTNKTGHT